MSADKFKILSDKSLNLLHADYTHAVERIVEALDDETEFEYRLPRKLLVAELRRMEAWIEEFDLNGAGAYPGKE